MEELELFFDAIEKQHKNPILAVKESLKNKLLKFEHIQHENLYGEEWCINKLDALEKLSKVSMIIDSIEKADKNLHCSDD